jgi:hypothetical protein
MDSSPARLEVRSDVLLAAEVGGHALVRMTREEVAAYRRRPGPAPQGWRAIPPSTLRYSDEQTIAAVAAVCRALQSLHAGDRGPFAEWGILAAPRFPGRAHLAVALDRFRSEGVWGVSPQLIPHFALHSQAGTLSLVLGTHGPNLGLGGGIHAATEGLLTALTWLRSGRVPGVWLALTGWSPEYQPNAEGNPAHPSDCLAMVLVLLPTDPAAPGRTQIRLVHTAGPETPAPLDLFPLSRRLARRDPSADVVFVSTSRRVVLHGGHAGSIIPRPHLDRSDRSHPDTWVAAVDATGRRRFELVTS